MPLDPFSTYAMPTWPLATVTAGTTPPVVRPGWAVAVVNAAGVTLSLVTDYEGPLPTPSTPRDAASRAVAYAATAGVQVRLIPVMPIGERSYAAPLGQMNTTPWTYNVRVRGNDLRIVGGAQAQDQGSDATYSGPPGLGVGEKLPAGCPLTSMFAPGISWDANGFPIGFPLVSP